jgi:hypothetical protein
MSKPILLLQVCRTRWHISRSVLSFLISVVIGCHDPDETRLHDIARLDLGRRRAVVIKTEADWEILQTLYYEIEVSGDVIVPATAFLSLDPQVYGQLPLDVVIANNGSVIGVIYTASDAGKQLVIVHDFVTNEGWPHLYPNEVSYSDSAIQRKNRLFKQLRSENPDVSVPRIGTNGGADERHPESEGSE